MLVIGYAAWLFPNRQPGASAAQRLSSTFTPETHNPAAQPAQRKPNPEARTLHFQLSQQPKSLRRKQSSCMESDKIQSLAVVTNQAPGGGVAQL